MKNLLKRIIGIGVCLSLVVFPGIGLGFNQSGNINTVCAEEVRKEETVYITKTGKCYHNANCKCLKKSSKTVDIKDAEKDGYRKCKKCVAAENKAKHDEKAETVYMTKHGKCYHKANCRHLKKSSIPIEIADAKKENYSPCKHYRP